MPTMGIDLGEENGLLLASFLLEEAQLDGLGDLGEEAEVRAGAIERGAEGKGLSGPHLTDAVHRSSTTAADPGASRTLPSPSDSTAAASDRR